MAALTISLVPTGQPYGQRQTTETGMAEAGLPLTAPQTPPAPPRGELRQPTPRPRGTFDAFASRTPTSVGQLRVDPDSRLLDTLAQSTSPVLRDLAARLRGF